MFTGIVQAIGKVADVKAAGQSAVVLLEAGGLDLSDVAKGDSIACNGICLTVTALRSGGFTVDVSQETLGVTTGFRKGAAVNLEKALRLADRLGGHLVSGHVDGIGEIVKVKPVEGNLEMIVRCPGELTRYVARKGSMTVNGVSLTVNAVDAGELCVNLIPHTLSATNLGQLKCGDWVNLEVDLVARYVEQLLKASK